MILSVIRAAKRRRRESQRDVRNVVLQCAGNEGTAGPPRAAGLEREGLAAGWPLGMLEKGRGPERRRRLRRQFRHGQRDERARAADQDFAAVVTLFVVAGSFVPGVGRRSGGRQQFLRLRGAVLKHARCALGGGGEAEATQHERDNSSDEPAGHEGRF